MTLIESMQKYLDNYLILIERDEYVNIDWLGHESVSFSISANPLGQDGRYFTDVVGNRLMNYSIMFSVLFDNSEALKVSIENSSFFEDLMNWIEDNNKNGVYPAMREGLTPLRVQIQQTPYLFQTSENNQQAQYAILLQLQYKKGR